MSRKCVGVALLLFSALLTELDGKSVEVVHQEHANTWTETSTVDYHISSDLQDDFLFLHSSDSPAALTSSDIEVASSIPNESSDGSGEAVTDQSEGVQVSDWWTPQPEGSLFDADVKWEQAVEHESSQDPQEVELTTSGTLDLRNGTNSEVEPTSLEPIDPVDGSYGYLHSSSASGPNYLLISICNARYFCPEGSRGPCRRNQVLTSGRRPDSQPSCLGESSLWAMGCYLAGGPDPGQDLSDYEGHCALREAARPCSGYPPTFRYMQKTGGCYPLSSSRYRGTDLGPCGEGSRFVDADGVNGKCKCRDVNAVIWPEDDTCYRVYTRGPCAKGEWIAVRRHQVVCERSPCRQQDGRHIYWDHVGRPGCYRSHTRGPCSPGHLFIIKDFVKGQAECVPWNTARMYHVPYDDARRSWNEDINPPFSYFHRRAFHSHVPAIYYEPNEPDDGIAYRRRGTVYYEPYRSDSGGIDYDNPEGPESSEEAEHLTGDSSDSESEELPDEMEDAPLDLAIFRSLPFVRMRPTYYEPARIYRKRPNRSRN